MSGAHPNAWKRAKSEHGAVIRKWQKALDFWNNRSFVSLVGTRNEAHARNAHHA